LIFCWYPTEVKNPIISVLTALAFKDESIRTEYVVKMNVDMSQGMADVSLS
jgi:tRNA 2-selenouridine synthase SelU